MQAEADRRAGIRTPVPRAEPDQVVRSAVRDDRGRILGRYAGAITAGMVDKQDVNAPQISTQFDAEKAHEFFSEPFTLEQGLNKTLDHEFINPKNDNIS